MTKRYEVARWGFAGNYQYVVNVHANMRTEWVASFSNGDHADRYCAELNREERMGELYRVLFQPSTPPAVRHIFSPREDIDPPKPHGGCYYSDAELERVPLPQNWQTAPIEELREHYRVHIETERRAQHKDAIPPPAYTFIEESAPFPEQSVMGSLFGACADDVKDEPPAPGKIRIDGVDYEARVGWNPSKFCEPTTKVWNLSSIVTPQHPTHGERVRCCRAHADPVFMFNDEVWKSLKERCDG